jgi:hypothetical protein
MYDTAYTVHIQCIYTAYALHIHCIYIAYTQDHFPSDTYFKHQQQRVLWSVASFPCVHLASQFRYLKSDALVCSKMYEKQRKIKKIDLSSCQPATISKFWKPNWAREKRSSVCRKTHLKYIWKFRIKWTNIALSNLIYSIQIKCRYNWQQCVFTGL